MDQLFNKYQRELCSFLNTTFGRDYLISNLGFKKELSDKYPIVKVGPSGIHQLLGFTGKVTPVLRYTTGTGSKCYGECMVRWLGQAVWELEYAVRRGFKIDSYTSPYVILYFLNKAKFSKLDQMLSYLPRPGLSTLTVNPQAGNGGGNVTVDDYPGEVDSNSVNQTWGTVRGAAGNASSPTDTFIYPVDIKASTVSAKWAVNICGKTTFDTSPLTSSAVISAATYSLFLASKNDAPLGITPDMGLYTIGGTANTGTGTDYATRGTVLQAAVVTYGSLTASQYNDWTVNATGISHISLTGVTFFAPGNNNYDALNTAPTWTSGGESYTQFNSADHAATTNPPKLVITYIITAGGNDWPIMTRSKLWSWRYA